MGLTSSVRSTTTCLNKIYRNLCGKADGKLHPLQELSAPCTTCLLILLILQLQSTSPRICQQNINKIPTPLSCALCRRLYSWLVLLLYIGLLDSCSTQPYVGLLFSAQTGFQSQIRRPFRWVPAGYFPEHEARGAWSWPIASISEVKERMTLWLQSYKPLNGLLCN